MRRAGLALAAGALAACGTFEDPSIVIDRRPLAVVATPPEQVVAIDPQNPTAVDFEDVEVCALVAEPDRVPLAWSLVACPPQRDLRCTDLEAPFTVVDRFVAAGDPRAVGQVACAVVPGDATLTAIVRHTIENDSLQGFGGVDINVSIRIAPVGGSEDEAVYAGKAVRFSAKVPAERVANTNPGIGEILVQVDRGGGFDVPENLRTGACLDAAGRLTVAPGNVVKLAPRALEGSEETYVVPTFEGGTRVFTENLRYQWLATSGSWSRDETGGPRDPAGNPPAVSTEWRAPRLADGEDQRLVDLWIVQRDERGGASFVEACIAVVR